MADKKIIYEGTFTLPSASASDSEQKEETYSVLLEVADPLESHVSEREAWKRAIQNQYEMFEVKSLCVLADKKDEFRGFEFALRLKRCDNGTEHKTILHVRPRILHAGNFINY